MPDEETPGQKWVADVAEAARREELPPPPPPDEQED